MADDPAAGARPPDKAWPAPGDTQPFKPVGDQAPPPLMYVPVPTPTGFGFRPQTESSAVIALVLAVSSWIVCPVFAAIAALLIAGGAKARIQASGGALTGLTLVTVARWLSWIHFGLILLGLFMLTFGRSLFRGLLP